MICFDVGGVLVKLRRSWVDVCLAAGLDIRGDAASDRAEDLRGLIMSDYVLGRISHEVWAERTAHALGDLYSAEEISRMHDAWILDEYAGVADIVDHLHASGVATACLSNTNHAHWARFGSSAEYPTVARLGSRHASHVLGCAKPDEAAFRALERATGVDAARVLFFDDIGVNVDAARAYGWNAERIDPTNETAPQIRAHLADYGVF
jgi:HAD superfamily hydrolase (TIGR01509 family)